MDARFARRRNRVRVGAEIFARSDLRGPHAQRALQEAYLTGARPCCLCRDDVACELYITRLGDSFVVKRMPDTGSLHAPGCEAYARIGPFAREIYSDEALTESGGTVAIRLSVALTLIDALGAGIARAHVHDVGPGVRARRPTMTLLGLLHLLWEEAELNQWRPSFLGRRSRATVYARLIEAARDRTLGPSRPLPDHLFVPLVDRGRHEGGARAAFEQAYRRLAARCPSGQRPLLLVCGELLRIDTAANGGHILRIAGMRDVPVWLPPHVEQALTRSYPATLRRLDAPAVARELAAVVIAGVALSEAGHARAHYVDLLEVTAQYIPVDSLHEGHIAMELVRRQRSFCKPMRYDADEGVLPDFRLLDTVPETAIEVWGMNSPDYLARKRVKLERYRAEGRTLWEWNAARGDPIPELPAPQALRRSPHNQHTPDGGHGRALASGD
jgi:hypothetical protein